MKTKLYLLALLSFGLSAAACTKQVQVTVTEFDGSSTAVTLSKADANAAKGEPLQEVASRSDLQIEEHDFDLGKVYQQHTYDVEFPFVVSGPDPILISEVGSSCGCTKPGIRPDWDPDFEGELWPWNREIPAGAKGTVVATFEANRYERIKTSTITVRGNFLSKKMELQVKAYVLPVFELTPKQIRFDELQIAQLNNVAVSREIKVVGMEAFKVLSWRRVTPGIQVQEIGEAKLLADDRMERNFRITATTDLPEGRLASSLIAETSLGNDLEFLVNGHVLGAINYAPSTRIGFGVFDQGQARVRTVKVESTGLDFPTPEIEVLGGAAQVMSAELNTTQVGKLYEIKISIGDTAPAGSYNGILRISFPEASGLQKKEITLNARIR